jgi:hypothetical protein
LINLLPDRIQNLEKIIHRNKERLATELVVRGLRRAKVVESHSSRTTVSASELLEQRRLIVQDFHAAADLDSTIVSELRNAVDQLVMMGDLPAATTSAERWQSNAEKANDPFEAALAVRRQAMLWLERSKDVSLNSTSKLAYLASARTKAMQSKVALAKLPMMLRPQADLWSVEYGRASVVLGRIQVAREKYPAAITFLENAKTMLQGRVSQDEIDEIDDLISEARRLLSPG